MYLIVGLGNPGREYAATRHNVGFLVVDELARRWKVENQGWKNKFGGELAQTTYRNSQQADEPIVLLKPQEFMNLSGGATQRVAAFYKIEPSHIVVIHDELDLDFGKLRVKVGGGHGGHNGLRSVSEQLGPAYIRVRCGVGKPNSKERTVGHVLGGFDKQESKDLPLMIGEAADAVETLLEKGPIVAMNKHNADKPRSA